MPNFFFGIVRLVTFCLERCQGGILYYLVNYPQIRSSSSTPPPPPPLPHSSLISRLTSSFDRSRSFHPFSTLHQFLSNFGLPYQLYQANNRGSCARACWTSEHPPQLDYQTPQAKTIILKSLQPTYPSQFLHHKQNPGSYSSTVPSVPLLQSPYKKDPPHHRQNSSPRGTRFPLRRSAFKLGLSTIQWWKGKSRIPWRYLWRTKSKTSNVQT